MLGRNPSGVKKNVYIEIVLLDKQLGSCNMVFIVKHFNEFLGSNILEYI